MASKNNFSAKSRGLLGLDQPVEVADPAANIPTETIIAPEPLPAAEPQTAKPTAQTPEPPKTTAAAEKTAAKAGQAKAKRGRPPKAGDPLFKKTIDFSEENLQFLQDITAIEGGSVTSVLNSLLDEFRVSRRAALDKALEIHKQSRKTWKDS